MQSQKKIAKRISNHYEAFKAKAIEYQTVTNARIKLDRLQQE